MGRHAADRDPVNIALGGVWLAAGAALIAALGDLAVHQLQPPASPDPVSVTDTAPDTPH